MFRASLRSVSDPLRDHVCLSCIARGFNANTALRRLYVSTAAKPEQSNDGPANETSKAVPDSLRPSLSPIVMQKQKRKRLERARAKKSKLAQVLDSVSKETKSSPLKEDSGYPTEGRPPHPRETNKVEKKQAPKAARKQKAEKKDAEKSSEETASAAAPPEKPQQLKGESNKGKPSPTKDTAPGKKARPTAPTGKVRQILEEVKKGKDSSAQGAAPAAKARRSRHIVDVHSGSCDLSNQRLDALKIPTAPVPRLSFGLERVLFNPGVYHLRDARSRVYNFDPYLGSIMPVTEFDFAALKDYITSSKDEILREVAVKQKKKYIGSSSSMTSVLSHFHYLLSAWRPIDTRTVSQGFPEKMRTFTRLLRSPAAMILRYQDGVYAVDADKEFDSANILMNLGKSMEKLLTLPKEEFERYRRSHENKISAEEEQATPESYHYSTMNNFIMRSQLDAYDPRLPGTGMFDLKTRAVVSIRMDATNFEQGLGYEIKGRFGTYESYEREYFDMIRAAFLKYSLQVRIGRMDGIFVAFHNVQRIFGFQYISLPEMDQALHGQYDTSLGDAEFKLSMALWDKVLEKATRRFPMRSLRFHFETRDNLIPSMYVFAEPVTDEEIHEIQTKNKADIDAYQKRLLKLEPKNDDSAIESPPPAPSDSSDTESSPPPPSDPSIQLPDPAYDSTLPPDESFAEETEEEDSSDPKQELLALTLTVRNKVNDRYVERPKNFKASDKWTVHYEMTEMTPAYGRTLLDMCRKRRQKALQARGEDESDVASNMYIRRLRELSQDGRSFRERENNLDKLSGVVVLDDPGRNPFSP